MPLANAFALLGLFVGGGLFVVNVYGGSGFDVLDDFRGIRDTLLNRRRAYATYTPKIIPRFRYGALIGSIIFLASLIYIISTN